MHSTIIIDSQELNMKTTVSYKLDVQNNVDMENRK